MYNLTEQQVRKLIEDAWSASRTMQNFVRHGVKGAMPNDLAKHTASTLATLQQSATASSVGEKEKQDYTPMIKKLKDYFASVSAEQLIKEWEELGYHFVDADTLDVQEPDWFEQNVLRAEEAPKEDENPTPVDWMDKAVRALFLELPDVIAKDVQDKWESAKQFLLNK